MRLPFVKVCETEENDWSLEILNLHANFLPKSWNQLFHHRFSDLDSHISENHRRKCMNLSTWPVTDNIPLHLCLEKRRVLCIISVCLPVIWNYLASPTDKPQNFLIHESTSSRKKDPMFTFKRSRSTDFSWIIYISIQIKFEFMVKNSLFKIW